MSVGGWLMMVFSWTLILGLSGFCMKKVIQLKSAKAKHIKPILEIDTGDFEIPPSAKKKKEK